jgi:hypothetical protein
MYTTLCYDLVFKVKPDTKMKPKFKGILFIFPFGRTIKFKLHRYLKQRGSEGIEIIVINDCLGIENTPNGKTKIVDNVFLILMTTYK